MQKKLLVTLVCGLGMLPALQAQNNLTLQQALHAARSNNPFLKPAALDTSIAQSDVITAGLRPNPTLNNQTLQNASSKHFAPNTKFYEPENRQVWWQVTKQFNMSGQRKYRQEVATKNAAIAGKDYANTERDVLLDAGNKWLDVWYHSKNLQLLQEAKSNIDSLVQTQELRLKNQVISSNELTRTQLLSEQYQLQLKTSQQNFKNELQNLKLATGDANAGIDTTDALAYFAINQQVDSLIHLSFHQRPDLQSAQLSIDAAQSNIKLQHALSKPVPEMGVIYNPQNTVQYVGFYGTIDLPFFSRNQGEIKKSKITLQQSQQSFTALQQQVSTEVQTVYASWQVSKENVQHYENILQKATQVLTSVKYAYTRGGTTIIDFLDAQRTWFDTQKMYYDAVYEYRQNYLQLLHATGLITQL
ncbi:outer membrane protein, cobalt-zinc-cadmium efflux system [Filimonas lacunae]|uniref:Outer membrane protein, cobalt-zinc-cadmium efflux system n=1 Tax=Filimonas lacunae TaxID=477680 RepID=A0A173MDY2_9BACT|nr:TolC family protein [Filimonas lacunae]BAV05638.1 heavy metal RND efflux outer membrane protein, CzcC family [Filimonas lacunae]SIT29099.1 outer membrane protein, cobalt-zinc-cadmium efflux system [Filimonas lacunae]